MTIPTEQIGNIPRPQSLIEAITAFNEGKLSEPELDRVYHIALKENMMDLEATGSPIITSSLDPNKFTIVLANGQLKALPVTDSEPLKYRPQVVDYLKKAKTFTQKPIKQTIISASALSLMYPQKGIPSYSRSEFLADLLDEIERDIRECLKNGAYKVQMNFAEGQLSLKVDPTKHMLRSFIDLNNLVFERFTDEERQRIGVSICQDSDVNPEHHAKIDYAELLPMLFEMKVGSFYIAISAQKDRPRIYQLIKEYIKPYQRVFVGVINPNEKSIETPEDVKNRILEAARFIPISQLGTTDDCGFSTFPNNKESHRETAFAKIRARVQGTLLASKELKLLTTMEKIHQSKYQLVYYDKPNDLFHYVFHDYTRNMTTDEYVHELKVFIELVRRYKPKRMLGDMVNFQFIIVPDLQEWIGITLFRVFKEIGFRKIAIILSEGITESISIQQTMEENQTRSFQTAYFDQEDRARDWLLKS